MEDPYAITECRGEHGAGCGLVFERKKEAGLCAGCHLVDVMYKDNPIERKRFQDMRQCKLCGIKRQNLPPSTDGNVICGRCLSDIAKEQTITLVTPAPVNQPTTSAPLGHQSVASPLNQPITPTQPTQAVAAAEAYAATFVAQMQAGQRKTQQRVDETYARHRQAHLSVHRQINLYLEFMTTGSKPKSIAFIGHQTNTVPADRPLQDAIWEQVKYVNANVWEPNTSGSLKQSDYFVRFPNNIALTKGTENGTVGDVYDTHVNLPTSNPVWFLLPGERRGTKKKSSIGDTIHLWVMLKIPQIQDRDGPLPDGFIDGKLSTNRGKRARDSEDDGDDEKSAKRRAPPISTFRPDFEQTQGHMLSKSSVSPHTVANTLDGFEPVKLKFAKWTSKDFGRGDLSWDSDDMAIKNVQLACTPFASGASKLVYHVLMDNGERVVAKRYATIPAGGLGSLSVMSSINQIAQKIPIAQNADFLQKELEVQHQGQYFLDNFYDCVRRSGATASMDFAFTKCWLAHEVIDDSVMGPSKASDVNEDELSNLETSCPGIVWLIEPFHATQTTKYSGTLVEVQEQTLPFMTMGGFSHFSYHWSKNTLVFVDLQSCAVRTSGGSTRRILFDAMTHTLKGTSGPGDHGPKGIDNYVENHHCTRVCSDIGIDFQEVPDEKHQSSKSGKQRSTAPRRHARGRAASYEDFDESDSENDDQGVERSIVIHN